MISTLSDEELDELLAGHTPEGRGELSPLADVAIAVRRRTVEERAPVMGYPLRQAVARGSAPAARARRPFVPVAAAAAAIAVLGLAGAANALPAPVQNAVADAGDLVGLDLPHATDETVVEPRDGEDPPGPAGPSTHGEGTGGEHNGPPDVTPGGATPADPGTPGDQEPATPAIPPEPSDDGNPNSTGPDAGSGAVNADPRASERGDNATAEANLNAEANANPNASADD